MEIQTTDSELISPLRVIIAVITMENIAGARPIIILGGRGHPITIFFLFSATLLLFFIKS